ncbi:unnamed protein product [Medioppia subpectinata]|uniref:Uncharacterized protein n=1 Tax=Medioppia subpectinata TaxID=1979941 RepID=A0A7R9KBF2_9ACAR|nr:unnamed protein product [Medioppia subpectinata]CAG2100091.1 unnamed protein product [Medioppia subpectinata]
MIKPHCNPKHNEFCLRFSFPTVVTRVLSSDSKTVDPMVGRRKLVPDFESVKSVDSNDLIHNSRPNSGQPNTTDRASVIDNQPKPNDNYMDDTLAPDTEYRQSYTWNKISSNNNNDNNYSEENLSQSEYKSSFGWPKNARETQHKEFETTTVPGKAVPVENTMKKSLTMSSLSEVADRPEETSNAAPSHEPKTKKSEYNAKFRPFSAYIYVSGNGFKKPKNVDAMDEVDKVKNWYSEVEERSRQANHYKTRSQLGHPVASEGLNQIYSQGSIWNNYHRDRNLQALALETTQKIIEEKKQERSGRAVASAPKTGRKRCLSSAPPTLRSQVHNTTNATVRTKSPQTLHSRSADRQPKKLPKTAPIAATPKPEGKIWLKPKPKPQESTVEKKPVPKHLPLDSNANESKVPNLNERIGSKSSHQQSSHPKSEAIKSSKGPAKAAAHPVPSDTVKQSTHNKSNKEITKPQTLDSNETNKMKINLNEENNANTKRRFSVEKSPISGNAENEVLIQIHSNGSLWNQRDRNLQQSETSPNSVTKSLPLKDKSLSVSESSDNTLKDSHNIDDSQTNTKPADSFMSVTEKSDENQVKETIDFDPKQIEVEANSQIVTNYDKQSPQIVDSQTLSEKVEHIKSNNTGSDNNDKPQHIVNPNIVEIPLEIQNKDKSLTITENSDKTIESHDMSVESIDRKSSIDNRKESEQELLAINPQMIDKSIVPEEYSENSQILDKSSDSKDNSLSEEKPIKVDLNVDDKSLESIDSSVDITKDSIENLSTVDSDITDRAIDSDDSSLIIDKIIDTKDKSLNEEKQLKVSPNVMDIQLNVTNKDNESDIVSDGKDITDKPIDSLSVTTESDEKSSLTTHQTIDKSLSESSSISMDSQETPSVINLTTDNKSKDISLNVSKDDKEVSLDVSHTIAEIEIDIKNKEKSDENQLKESTDFDDKPIETQENLRKISIAKEKNLLFETTEKQIESNNNIPEKSGKIEEKVSPNTIDKTLESKPIDNSLYNEKVLLSLNVEDKSPEYSSLNITKDVKEKPLETFAENETDISNKDNTLSVSAKDSETQLKESTGFDVKPIETKKSSQIITNNNKESPQRVGSDTMSETFDEHIKSDNNDKPQQKISIDNIKELSAINPQMIDKSIVPEEYSENSQILDKSSDSKDNSLSEEKPIKVESIITETPIDAKNTNNTSMSSHQQLSHPKSETINSSEEPAKAAAHPVPNKEITKQQTLDSNEINKMEINLNEENNANTKRRFSVEMSLISGNAENEVLIQIHSNESLYNQRDRNLQQSETLPNSVTKSLPLKDKSLSVSESSDITPKSPQIVDSQTLSEKVDEYFESNNNGSDNNGKPQHISSIDITKESAQELLTIHPQMIDKSIGIEEYSENSHNLDKSNISDRGLDSGDSSLNTDITFQLKDKSLTINENSSKTIESHDMSVESIDRKSSIDITKESAQELLAINSQIIDKTIGIEEYSENSHILDKLSDIKDNSLSEEKLINVESIITETDNSSMSSHQQLSHPKSEAINSSEGPAKAAAHPVLSDNVKQSTHNKPNNEITKQQTLDSNETNKMEINLNEENNANTKRRFSVEKSPISGNAENEVFIQIHSNESCYNQRDRNLQQSETSPNSVTKSLLLKDKSLRVSESSDITPKDSHNIDDSQTNTKPADNSMSVTENSDKIQIEFESPQTIVDSQTLFEKVDEYIESNNNGSDNNDKPQHIVNPNIVEIPLEIQNKDKSLTINENSGKTIESHDMSVESIDRKSSINITKESAQELLAINPQMIDKSIGIEEYSENSHILDKSSDIKDNSLSKEKPNKVESIITETPIDTKKTNTLNKEIEFESHDMFVESIDRKSSIDITKESAQELLAINPQMIDKPIGIEEYSENSHILDKSSDSKDNSLSKEKPIKVELIITKTPIDAKNTNNTSMSSLQQLSHPKSEAINSSEGPAKAAAHPVPNKEITKQQTLDSNEINKMEINLNEESNANTKRRFSVEKSPISGNAENKELIQIHSNESLYNQRDRNLQQSETSPNSVTKSLPLKDKSLSVSESSDITLKDSHNIDDSQTNTKPADNSMSVTEKSDKNQSPQIVDSQTLSEKVDEYIESNNNGSDNNGKPQHISARFRRLFSEY